jgi:hypothetical protein
VVEGKCCGNREAELSHEDYRRAAVNNKSTCKTGVMDDETPRE